MLPIVIPKSEFFNDVDMTFISVEETRLQLEHSLVSISKWESKWHKAFLGNQEKTEEELLDYVRCMTINEDVDPLVYSFITTSQMQEISDYIQDPMTATWFSENSNESGHRNSGEVITSELIYYWMISLTVPVEFENWHLNRLLTLIRVCNVKNTPPKKMSKREIMNRNRALNEIRKKNLNTNG